MILAFAGRRAPALHGATRSVRPRIEQLLGDLRPRIVVGGAADGADLMVAEAALRMPDGPVVHLVLPTAPETFRADSVALEWRDRFDAVVSEAVRRGGTLNGLGLPPGQDAYRRGNQAILEKAVGFQDQDERLVVLVIASPGEGRMIEDLVGHARLRGLPILRIDPAADGADRTSTSGADPRSRSGRRTPFDGTAGIRSVEGEER